MASRFDAIKADVSILLVGDDSTAAEADSVVEENQSEDSATAIEAEQETPPPAAKAPAHKEFPLECTVETLEDLISLFDVNRGLDLSHPPICAWLRSILVPNL